MLIPAALHDGLRDGTVTLAFRSWLRPTVKAGGTLITAVGQLAIDAVDVIDPEEITDADALRAGAASAAEVVSSLRSDDARRRAYRVAFHVAGDDPRVALRSSVPDDAELAALRRRLGAMDARAADGPWTAAVLRTIAERPATVSTELAAAVGLPRPELKTRVRRLKALGLTESLGVGYRISPRGERVLRMLADQRQSEQRP